MTNKEIIEIANQAGFECTIHKQFTKANTFVEVGTVVEGDFASLTQFAKLIAEKEREECAKIADSYADGLERNYSEIIADKIRARGNND